jgi:hypothetical protein
MIQDIPDRSDVTVTERELARNWAAIIERDVESIDSDEDFIELGGSSLEATVCVVR